MASPAAPPASSGAAGKLLAGCALGCVVVALLAVVACGAFYLKVAKPAIESVQEMEQAEKEARRLAEDLRALDQGAASDLVATPPEDVVLEEADVDRYVEVRRALAEPAMKHERAGRAFGEAMDPAALATPSGFFGAVQGMLGGVRDAASSRVTLLREAGPALEAAGMTPDELERLMQLVEWRFLRREDAFPLAFPDSERGEAAALAFQVQLLERLATSTPAGVSASDREQMERQLEEVRERAARLREEADERTELHPRTRELLESRRAELEALPAEGLTSLASLTAADPMQLFGGAAAAGDWSSAAAGREGGDAGEGGDGSDESEGGGSEGGGSEGGGSDGGQGTGG